ncbi:ABC transporter permease subunit [Actinotalea sp.]|uniref:ABC transporter permease subunit n=1 Tax=Actinotalea sp. TaxID=1872145 RepID=UPI003561BA08
MTTLTTTPVSTGGHARRTSPTGSVTFPRVVHAEWIKFRSVRATPWTLGMTVLSMVGIAVLAAWGTSSLAEDPGTMSALDTVQILTAGWFIAEITVVVLAVLSVSGEYSTGMIRSSMTAVPRRVPVILAKALVVAIASALTTVLALALAWLAVQPWAGSLGLSLDLGDPDVLRVLLGTPLVLATVALLALAVGALLRSPAAALATVLGVLLVVENVLSLLPFVVVQRIAVFMPSSAGTRLLQTPETLAFLNENPDTPDLSAWQGYGVLAIWVVLLLGLALTLLRRRDV